MVDGGGCQYCQWPRYWTNVHFVLPDVGSDENSVKLLQFFSEVKINVLSNCNNTNPSNSC